VFIKLPILTIFSYRDMFYRLTVRPSEYLGFFSHIRELEWLIRPPFLTAETVALLTALVIKDCALLSWEENSEASSLCSLLEDHMNKKQQWPWQWRRS